MNKIKNTDKNKMLIFFNIQLKVPATLLSKYSDLYVAAVSAPETILAPGVTLPKSHLSNYDVDVSNVRSLFLFRDKLIKQLLPEVGLDVLIIGGSSQVIMAQYYIFKKLVGPENKIVLFGDKDGKGISSLVDLMMDKDFDGKSHYFQKENLRDEFATWTEVDE